MWITFWLKVWDAKDEEAMCLGFFHGYMQSWCLELMALGTNCWELLGDVLRNYKNMLGKR